jgi:uncharacterized protein YneF (UPF0154 family)
MEHVYFFRETGRPYVKIGMTKNEIETRFNSFKTYAPLGAYIVGFIKTKDSFKLENELHEQFKDKRVFGEFFNISDDEVYNIINKYNSSFGEIVSFMNTLIEDYDYSLNDLKNDLLKKIKDLELLKEKYKPSQEIINYLSSKRGQFLTNNTMLNELNDNGNILNQYELAMILKRLGYKKKRKRVNGISAIVYIL